MHKGRPSFFGTFKKLWALKSTNFKKNFQFWPQFLDSYGKICVLHFIKFTSLINADIPLGPSFVCLMIPGNVKTSRHNLHNKLFLPGIKLHPIVSGENQY